MVFKTKVSNAFEMSVIGVSRLRFARVPRIARDRDHVALAYSRLIGMLGKVTQHPSPFFYIGDIYKFLEKRT